jgi:hypothetical protein
LGGNELVSQEREKSGSKKYPVLGIFQKTSSLLLLEEKAIEQRSK